MNSRYLDAFTACFNKKNKHVLHGYFVSVFINIQADTLAANNKLSKADLLNLPMPKLE